MIVVKYEEMKDVEGKLGCIILLKVEGAKRGRKGNTLWARITKNPD